MKIIAQNISYYKVPRKVENKEYKPFFLTDKPNVKINNDGINFKSLLKKTLKPNVLNYSDALRKIESFCSRFYSSFEISRGINAFRTKSGYSLDKIQKLSFFNKLDEKDIGAEALYHAITNLFITLMVSSKGLNRFVIA